MALAKFLEDRIERFLEGNFKLPHYASAVPTLPRIVSDEVQAKSLDGSLFEDFVVLTTGERFEFVATTESAECDIEVVLEGNPSWVRLKQCRLPRHYAVSSAKPAGFRMRLTCGAYHKWYQIAFVPSVAPDSIPDVDILLKSLDTNPVTWTTAYGMSLRVRLTQILQKHELPREFADGVYEYHLGLVHEAEGDDRFAKRLERAFALLRPFAKLSPYANLVCRYFLFRTNDFLPVVPSRRRSALDTASSFFLAPFECREESISLNGVRAKGADQLHLLIALPDHFVIEAALAYNSGDIDAASNILDKSRKEKSAVDLQREVKQSFLAARIARCKMDIKTARRYYTAIQFSSCKKFKEEANDYLAKIS